MNMGTQFNNCICSIVVVDVVVVVQTFLSYISTFILMYIIHCKTGNKYIFRLRNNKETQKYEDE